VAHGMITRTYRQLGLWRSSAHYRSKANDD
jgi:hypothetical protein